MIDPTLTAAIEALIARELPHSDWRDDRALASPRALRIYSTSALYSYYLAPDGTVYERDLDSSRGAEAVDSRDVIRETYAKAAALFPELAGLAP